MKWLMLSYPCNFSESYPVYPGMTEVRRVPSNIFSLIKEENNKLYVLAKKNGVFNFIVFLNSRALSFVSRFVKASSSSFSSLS